MATCGSPTLAFPVERPPRPDPASLPPCRAGRVCGSNRDSASSVSGNPVAKPARNADLQLCANITQTPRLASRRLLVDASPAQSVSAMGLAPAMGRGPNQGNSRSQNSTGKGLLNPTAPSSQRLRDSGWALPLSLAVTWDIAVAFFSSAY